MAANNRGFDYGDLWRIYKEQEEIGDDYSKDLRAQIIHLMQLHKLGNLSYKVQLEVLDNAPLEDNDIKKHFHLLHDEAKKRLGLEVKTKKKKQELDFYGAFG